MWVRWARAWLCDGAEAHAFADALPAATRRERSMRNKLNNYREISRAQNVQDAAGYICTRACTWLVTVCDEAKCE